MKRLFSHKLCLCMLFILSSSFCFGKFHVQYKKHRYDQSITNLKQGFRKLCKTKQFSGVVLVALDGRIRMLDSCGYANKEKKIKNNKHTQFNLASLSKLFTSLAIAQLLEKKGLSLEDKVYPFVAHYLPSRYAKEVTFLDLLTHQSGLDNYMTHPEWKKRANTDGFNRIIDFKPVIANSRFRFKPSTNQLYSNSGYIILGALIEALSGQSYKHYIEKNIFKAAKMEESVLLSRPMSSKINTLGYERHCQKKCLLVDVSQKTPQKSTSAGGAYSTVIDLYRFSKALRAHQLLPPYWSRKLLSVSAVKCKGGVFDKTISIGGINVSESFSDYGFAGHWNPYGFAVWQNPALIGHTGGTEGFSALLIMSPSKQYTFIILSNLTNANLKMYQLIRNSLHLYSNMKNL